MPANRIAVLLEHVSRMFGTPPDAGADATLLERFARDADESAFAALVQRHGPLVWNVSRQATRHEQDAEDVYQATFLLLARKAATISDGGSLGNWLYGVAHRLALRARCDAARRRQRELRATVATAMPADDLTWRELREVLDDELARLPDKYRAPLVLCYFDELTHKEAARQLGWSIRSVRDRLQRGRKRLRARLTKRGLTLSMTLAGSLLAGGLAAAPPPVTEAILCAGVAFAVRRTPGGTVSAGALALAEGGLKTMFVGKLYVLAAALVAVVSLIGAGLLGARPPQEAVPEIVATGDDGDGGGKDRYGDLLPPGAVTRLGTVRFRFRRTIPAFLPDGKTVVSTGPWHGIELWDARTGRLLRAIDTGNFSIASGAPLSRDGKRALVSGAIFDDTPPGWRSAMRVYDLPSGKVLRAVERRPPEGVSALALTPDGKFQFTRDHKGKVRIEEVATGAELLRQQFPNDVFVASALSPDGSTLALALGPDTHKLFLWTWQTAEEPRAVECGWYCCHHLAFSPDSKLLAECSDAGLDVRLWDVANGRVLRKLELPDHKPYHHHRVAFGPNGKLLAASGMGNGRGAVHLWDPTTGKFLHRLDIDGAELAFSPDGSLLVAGSRVWDLAAGKELSANEEAHSSLVERILTGGKNLVVTASGNHTVLRIRDDAGRPDEPRTMWVRTNDESVRIWDAATGQQRHRLVHNGHVKAMALSPDASRLVSVSTEDSVCLWDVATGKQIYRLAGHGRYDDIAYAAVFTSDGKSFLTWGGPNMYLRKWDVRTGKTVFEQQVYPTGPRVAGEDGEPLPPDRRPLPLFAAAFTPDARHLVLELKERLYIFDAATGAELRSFPSEFIVAGSMAVSADGKLVLTSASGKSVLTKRPNGGEEYMEPKDHPVTWQDLTTGQRHEQLLPGGDGGGPVAFSPDGKVFATISWPDRSIRLLETATGREVRKIEGFRGMVRSLAFMPDGKRLVSGMDDSSALVWDLKRER